MHFQDLALCTYGRGAINPESWDVPLLAIGWLEDGHHFSTGETGEELIKKAKRYQQETWEEFPMFSYLGLHECSLCSSGRAARGIDGSPTNIFVPGQGRVYMASGGICHYMEEHSYLPPAEFVTALLTSPWPSSAEYHDAIVSANAGNRPQFLWTNEEHVASWERERSEQE